MSLGSHPLLPSRAPEQMALAAGHGTRKTRQGALVLLGTGRGTRKTRLGALVRRTLATRPRSLSTLVRASGQGTRKTRLGAHSAQDHALTGWMDLASLVLLAFYPTPTQYRYCSRKNARRKQIRTGGKRDSTHFYTAFEYCYYVELVVPCRCSCKRSALTASPLRCVHLFSAQLLSGTAIVLSIFRRARFLSHA